MGAKELLADIVRGGAKSRNAQVSVPCGSCQLCCKSEVLALLPEEGDVVENYEHTWITIPGVNHDRPVPVLKHKPNGDCIYLGDKGCTIHGRAPHICRIFDCRRFFRSHSRKERRFLEANSPGTGAIFRAGRKRLHTLDEVERAAGLEPATTGLEDRCSTTELSPQSEMSWFERDKRRRNMKQGYKETKGLIDGHCNRQACQAPLAEEARTFGKRYWMIDHETFTENGRLYYCAACAAKFDMADMQFGGTRRIREEML